MNFGKAKTLLRFQDAAGTTVATAWGEQSKWVGSDRNINALSCTEAQYTFIVRKTKNIFPKLFCIYANTQWKVDSVLESGTPGYMHVAITRSTTKPQSTFQ